MSCFLCSSREDSSSPSSSSQSLAEYGDFIGRKISSSFCQLLQLPLIPFQDKFLETSIRFCVPCTLVLSKTQNIFEQLNFNKEFVRGMIIQSIQSEDDQGQEPTQQQLLTNKNLRLEIGRVLDLPLLRNPATSTGTRIKKEENAGAETEETAYNSGSESSEVILPPPNIKKERKSENVDLDLEEAVDNDAGQSSNVNIKQNGSPIPGGQLERVESQREKYRKKFAVKEERDIEIIDLDSDNEEENDLDSGIGSQLHSHTQRTSVIKSVRVESRQENFSSTTTTAPPGGSSLKRSKELEEEEDCIPIKTQRNGRSPSPGPSNSDTGEDECSCGCAELGIPNSPKQQPEAATPLKSPGNQNPEEEEAGMNLTVNPPPTNDNEHNNGMDVEEYEVVVITPDVSPQPTFSSSTRRNLSTQSYSGRGRLGSSNEGSVLQSIKTWLSSVEPRSTPYIPQIKDELVYFRKGHEKYVSAVKSSKMYTITGDEMKSLPWKLNSALPAAVPVAVRDIKFLFKPPAPRLVSLYLEILDWRTGAGTGRVFKNVLFHDVSFLMDFLILRQRYNFYVEHEWNVNDRCRTLFEGRWWVGRIVKKVLSAGAGSKSKTKTTVAGDSKFEAYEVRWDYDSSVEILSPWDLEEVPDEDDSEGDDWTYTPNVRDWQPSGSMEVELTKVKDVLDKIMSLEIAARFLTTASFYGGQVDKVDYPVDLTMMRDRVDNDYYRRLDAIKFDMYYISLNAGRYFGFEDPQIVKNVGTIRLMFLKALG